MKEKEKRNPFQLFIAFIHVRLVPVPSRFRLKQLQNYEMNNLAITVIYIHFSTNSNNFLLDLMKSF